MQLICTNYDLSLLKYNSKPGGTSIFWWLNWQHNFLLAQFVYFYILSIILKFLIKLNFFLLLNHSKIILKWWMISFRAMLASFGDVLPIYLRRLNHYFGHHSVWYHWLILSLLVSRNLLVSGPYSCLDHTLFAI